MKYLIITLLILVVSISAEQNRPITKINKTAQKIDWNSLKVSDHIDITNNLHFNPRSQGFGSMGVITPFYDFNNNNPAILGFQNHNLQYAYYSSILPSSNLQDMRSFSFGSSYKFPEEQISLSFTYRKVGFEHYIEKNNRGQEIAIYNDNFNEFNLSFGALLKNYNKFSHFTGISANYILAPKVYDIYAKTRNGIVLGFGYYLRAWNLLNVGISIKNIGAKVSGVHHYVEKRTSPNVALTRKIVEHNSNFDYTPLTIFAGIGISHEIITKKNNSLKPLLEISIKKSFNEDNIDNFIFTSGGEIMFLNLISLRSGINTREQFSSFENHYGVGFNLFNHFKIDAYYINVSQGDEMPSSQKGISLTIDRIHLWKKSDTRWCKVH